VSNYETREVVMPKKPLTLRRKNPITKQLPTTICKASLSSLSFFRQDQHPRCQIDHTTIIHLTEKGQQHAARLVSLINRVEKSIDFISGENAAKKHPDIKCLHQQIFNFTLEEIIGILYGNLNAPVLEKGDEFAAGFLSVCIQQALTPEKTDDSDCEEMTIDGYLIQAYSNKPV
jgi:hypothetical protein